MLMAFSQPSSMGRKKLPEWATLIALSSLSCLVLTSGAAHATSCETPLGEHSAIQNLCAVHEGMTRYLIGGAWGFMDKSGKLVGEPRFDDAEDFSEGLAAVQVGKLWGFINKAGDVVIAPAFESVGNFSNGLAAATRSGDGKSGYIDRTGQWVIAPRYQTVGPFQVDTGMVSETYGNSLLIDRRGEVVKRFEAGLRVDESPNTWGLYKAERNGARYLWRRGGERIPAPQQLAPYFNGTGDGDGLWLATQDQPNGEGSLWGAVDQQGHWVVPARFAELGTFQNGLAVARPAKDATKDNADAPTLSGLIDRQGQFVQPARYQRIDRQPWGGYFAERPDHGGLDIISQGGKVLVSAETCRTLEEVSIEFAIEPKQWGVVKGCGQSWAFHAKAGMLQSRIAAPTAYASGTHLMLIRRLSEDGQDDGTEKAKGAALQFDIFDTAGRRTVSSDDASMQGDQALTGQDDDVFLIPSGNTHAAVEQQDGLPLALIIKDFEKVRVITRDGKVVTNPQWKYESNLLDYRYASRGKPLEGPLVVSTENGWGAIDGRGQWVVQPRYRRLSTFKDGVAFALDGKQWVLLERNGKSHALPEEGWQFTRVAPGVYMGDLRGDGDGQYIRFDMVTGQTTRVKLPLLAGYGDFHEGVASAQASDGQHWGLINDRGEWIVPPRFDRQFDAIVDEEDRIVGWRSTTYFKVDDSTESLYGWFSPQGQELAVPAYSAIDYDAEHGVLRLTKDGVLKGLMAPDGKLLLPAQYKDIQAAGDAYVLTEPTLYGLLDAHGEWSAPLAQVELSDLSNRPYQLKRRGADLVAFDIQGRQSTASAPQPIVSGQEEPSQWWWPHTEHAYEDNETTVFYGFDFKERVRIPGQLPSYAAFSEGVVTFTPRGASRREGEELALADSHGKVLGRYPYKEIGPMSDGFATFVQLAPRAPVGRKQAKTPSVDDYEPRTKIGYLDRQGKVAIPPAFDRAESFSEGRAVVVAKDNIGMIDTHGKLVVHGAWMCGREPVILDAAGRVQWPAAAAKKKHC